MGVPPHSEGAQYRLLSCICQTFFIFKIFKYVCGECRYIDLDKVTEVVDVPFGQQGSGNGTFQVVCIGRTYHIQAEMEADRTKLVY